MQELSSDMRQSLCALGICVGGIVNAHRTIDMSRENWNNVNLAAPLSAALQLPVYVEGVTRIKALYEIRYVDVSEKNVIFLNFSTGVGMTSFFDGKMVQGRQGLAGEVGHISLDIHGPQCYCGNYGCFEQFCGMDNILKCISTLCNDSEDVLYDIVVRKKTPITPRLLFLAHRMGSLAVHNLLCSVAEYLGAGIASIINIYDPDRIIISGYVHGEDDFLINRAISRARSRIINSFDRNVIISRARLESDNLHLPTSALVLKSVLERLL